nr:MAG TPA: hypothetical protein [Crassvirales sp.]
MEVRHVTDPLSAGRSKVLAKVTLVHGSIID